MTAASFLGTQIVCDDGSGPNHAINVTQAGPNTLQMQLLLGPITDPANLTISGHPELTNPTNFPISFI